MSEQLWASPRVSYIYDQQIMLGSLGYTVFFTVTSMTSGAIGTYLGCKSLSCAANTAPRHMHHHIHKSLRFL
jgi:hypothetical protein